MGVGLVVSLLVSLMQGVSCKTWDLMLPKSIVGIAESCITVPCGFKVPNNFENQVQNCTNGAIWRKEKMFGPLVFSGSNPLHNKIQGFIAGNLKQKNCTTVFQSFPGNYSNEYFLRLECPRDLKFTFQQGVTISAQPDPPPPLLPPVKQVAEGDLVTLQCSVPVFCNILPPPSLTWLPRDITWQEETQLQEKSDGQTVITSTVTFIASATHHNRSVTCCVSYPLTKGGRTKPSASAQRLTIMYAPRSTVATVHPSGPVSEGSIVTFTCSSDANPPVSLYTWYRGDEEGQLSKRAQGEMLILQVRLNNSGLYLCEAQSRRGSQKSRPVSLQVGAAGGCIYTLVVPCVICGVLFVLLILTVAASVNKYQSLSRRLKEFEQQAENTYTDLRKRSVDADYDQIQRQPEMKTSPDLCDYENMTGVRISEVSSGQSGELKTSREQL
ncbi:sialoadhesin isoform X2 [Notolabrus celidotus]|uniref:sialoadhesin isoform X2 n=1 Tax=Notolabrus celidotus TaxID=1203425 RepID=UPI0014907FB8|nr:sialoadhesin isoform X2 [Notolabrus celidotus]